MDIITLDFEAFWSTEHSLTKMNPIIYVLHPDTEIQSVSVKLNDGKTLVIFGEDRIQSFFSQIDWSDTAVAGHFLSEFDAMIAAWRFGIKPKLWMCTLAMAKPHYNLTVGVSLKALAKEVGLGEKGDLEAVNTKGKRLADFTPDEIKKMRVYNKQDTELCYGLLEHLLPLTSKTELKIIDATIRMLVEPSFVVDTELLQAALAAEKERKRKAILDVALAACEWSEGMSADECVEMMKPVLMSQPQFAGLLLRLGAEVPMKESKTAPGKMIPALAKTDAGMTDLLDHEDSRVAMAAAGRLGVKSSQLETRIETFLRVSEVCGGKLPMPYRYCGANTWRHSGTMKMNVQNMNRVDARNPKPSEVLRLSLKAPKGHVVVVVDSSNIELRGTHCLSGQTDTTEMLRGGMDLYCDFASTLFGKDITKADVPERFIGKTAHLGLQYGAAWEAFQRMVRYLSKQNGFPMDISDTESRRVVELWRGKHRQISDRESGMWGRCEEAIKAMYSGNTINVDLGDMCYTEKNRIITPGSRFLNYPDLRREVNGKGKMEWRYGRGRGESRIYGSMLLENLVQHLSRNIVMEQSLELGKYAKIVSSTHDECAIIVPESMAEQAVEYAVKCFSKAPSWWTDIPLAAEAGFATTYGDAK